MRVAAPLVKAGSRSRTLAALGGGAMGIVGPLGRRVGAGGRVETVVPITCR